MCWIPIAKLQVMWPATASWNVGLTALRVATVPLLGQLVTAVSRRGAWRGAARRLRLLGLRWGWEIKSASAVAFFENCAFLCEKEEDGVNLWTGETGVSVMVSGPRGITLRSVPSSTRLSLANKATKALALLSLCADQPTRGPNLIKCCVSFLFIFFKHAPTF